MILSLIAAIGKNSELGKGNQLLWNMPADMKHFRDTTRGHTVIMGRKTFESIGRPLPNRRNIVITRDTAYAPEGVEVMHSVDEALRVVSLEQGRKFEENQDEVEVFVIGGAQVYTGADFDADAFFPAIDSSWQEISREEFSADESNPFPYTFLVYKK